MYRYRKSYRRSKFTKFMLALSFVFVGGLFAAALSFATMGAVPSVPPAPPVAPTPAVVPPPPATIAVPSVVEQTVLAEPSETFDEDEENNFGEIIESKKKEPKPEPEKKTEKTTRKGKWILIDKSEFQLTLFDGDKVINTWGVALGRNPGQKQKKGDNKTPNGVFTVQQVQDASGWTHDFRDGKGVIKGAYGPWFIRLKTPPFTGIGIHGTHDPSSIGKLASEGCIRLQNDNVRELKKHVTVGMTVEIRE